MKALIERIIGSPEQFPIEHRFLNGSCGISMIFAFMIILNNIALQLDPMLNIFIGFSFFYLAFLYYCARIRKLYTFPLWGLIIFFISALPPAWFLNSGLLGSSIYICFFILSLLIVISRNKTRIVVGITYFVEIFVIIGIEYRYPGLAVPYGNRTMQVVDMTINLAFSLALLSALIILVMKNYEEEKRKADESNRLKSNFLANISHEIRTPMNSILGFSELLRGQSITEEEKRHYIDIITKNGTHLLKLIDDIIDLARIEAGEIIINERQFPLDSLMDELYDIFNLQAKDGGVEIVMKLPAGVRSGLIVADDTRLRQVLMNLLGNAVKFTEKGTIEFGYRIVGADRILFYVKDTGIGIGQEDIPHIFERFKQVDDSNTRRFGGAGLGLSISKKLISLMGGDIWLETEPGKGTTFSFTITFPPAPSVPDGGQRGVSGAHAVRSRDSWKNRTILVVEDDDDSYRYLERVLSRYGINVIRSTNGMEAIEACRTNRAIDCVLMDIQLPFVSGNEAARAIREIRKDLPIIAQSGNAYNTDREASIRAGCNEYLTKPVLPETLLAVLDRYL